MMFIRRPLVIASIFYLFITVVFNYTLVCNAFWSCTPSHPSDGIITEFISETSFQHMVQGKSPYAFHQKLFYPFYTSYALADPGSGHLPFYSLLRTLHTSSHNAILIIVSFNLFLNYLIMYLLLRKLQMTFEVSLLGGLVFGAMPFISYRVLNHYTYTPIFVFPLLFLFVYSLIGTSNRHSKVLYAICTSIAGAYILLTNFYYFISVGISVACLLLYGLLMNPKRVWRIFRANTLYIVLSLLIFVYLLRPWLHAVAIYNTLFTNAAMQGFGGAWVLSADLVNTFLPSEHNPLYRFMFATLSHYSGFLLKLNTMYLSGYSKNAYAGLLLLVSVPGLWLYRKKLPRQVSQPAFLYLAVAISFLLLSFGPFLQLFNRWFIELEGVAVVFPMPFLLLHYIPGMDTLRAPARFVPLYVFFLVLASSYLWQYIYHQIDAKRLRYMAVCVAFVIVIVDQIYLIPSPQSEYTSDIPMRIYEKIAQDPVSGAVLEIPFTVRDGFSYRGYVKAVTPMKGPLIYHQAVLGGYIARVAPEIFSYYDRLPFISYVLQTIDSGNSPDGISEKKAIKPFRGTSEIIRTELSFLNIKYIILKKDQAYSAPLAKLIVSTGYKKIFTQDTYDLYFQTLPKEETDFFNFTKIVPSYMLGTTDQNVKKLGYQFSSKATFFIHVKKSKSHLVFRSTSHSTRDMDIYVNGTFATSMSLEKSKKIYSVPIENITSGVYMINFVLADKAKDAEVTLYTMGVK